MIDPYRVVGPFLRRIDAERAHELAVRALRAGFVPAGKRKSSDPRLAMQVWGLSFPNPIGLAAGFDKNADVIDPMLRIGFGFVEIGTVTPRPQQGNPRPRLFRLPEDAAVINRMGFNNRGLEVVVQHITAHSRRGGCVGANIGRNRDSADPVADYVAGVKAFAGIVDYLVVNVSSPNTPGLRDLQDEAALRALLDAVVETRDHVGASTPILVKVAPDLNLTDLEGIVRSVTAAGIDGVVATNTTTDRPQTLCGRNRDEAGGLSGRPLMQPSTRVLAELYRLTDGRLPLIGVGGIADGADAYAKIRAGATLVQLYTALVYQGPALVRRIQSDLVSRLSADGFTTLAEAVGADHR